MLNFREKAIKKVYGHKMGLGMMSNSGNASLTGAPGRNRPSSLLSRAALTISDNDPYNASMKEIDFAVNCSRMTHDRVVTQSVALAPFALARTWLAEREKN